MDQTPRHCLDAAELALHTVEGTLPKLSPPQALGYPQPAVVGRSEDMSLSSGGTTAEFRWVCSSERGNLSVNP